MTKVVRSREELFEALLDERLALGVEARGRLVQEQDARRGQDGACDRHPLALAPRELHAALADDGVEPLGQAVCELQFTWARRAKPPRTSRAARLRAGEQEVLADRPVEQEVVLQDEAQLTAGSEASSTALQVDARPRCTRPSSGDRKETASAARVDLPEPELPTRATTVPGRDVEGDVASAPASSSACRRSSRSSKATLPSARGASSDRAASGRRPRRAWARSSAVRSSPAKASVIWVPMLAICTIGPTRKARNSVKEEELSDRELARSGSAARRSPG